MESAAARLRALMARGMVAAPGACDPFTAKLIERAGFEAVYLGGNALGLSLCKGQPLVTLTETVEYSARIARTVDLPLIVDAGAGFGAPAHVHRSVWELESTGAAAIHIDDQPYPKSPSYHRGAGELVPLPEAVAKLSVAVQARKNPDFMIVARTDAVRVTGSIAEAITRGRVYSEIGVDALMILDLEPHQVGAVRAALPDIPLIWIGGVVPPVPSIGALQQAGFGLALYPFNTIAAIAETVSALWSGMRDSGEMAQSSDLLKRMRLELADIAGMKTYWEIEDRLASRASFQQRGDA